MSPWIRYRSYSFRTLLIWLTVVAVAWLTSSTVIAQDPLSGKPGVSTAKLNQSVALDAEQYQGVARGDDVGAEHVGAALVGSEPAGDGAAREYLPLRDERRGIRAGAKALPAADRSGPWYRSGFGAMVVVFVAIGLVYFMVRKYMPGSVIVPCQGVKVIGRVSLSPKHRAVLVKLGDRAILIGLGGDQMTTLAEITDQDEVARLSQESNPGSAAMSPEFNSWLRREQEDYSNMEDAEASGVTDSARTSRRTPIGDLLNKLRSFQKTSLRR